jgi:hypothetical protein
MTAAKALTAGTALTAEMFLTQEIWTWTRMPETTKALLQRLQGWLAWNWTEPRSKMVLKRAASSCHLGYLKTLLQVPYRKV